MPRERAFTHRPTYEFTGRSHWAACSCGWRSGLSASKADVEAQFARHQEEEA